MKIPLYIYKVNAWARQIGPACVLLLSFLWSACSQIDESERFIYVPPAEVNRAVLVEDFTGQRCVNCPAATEELVKLQEQYGHDNVVVVAIHSGPFGHRSTISSPRLPLCTETGDLYFSQWNVEAQPGTLINRVGGVCYDPTQYGKRIADELQKSTPVSLDVMASGNAEGGQVMVTVTANSTLPFPDAKLQVWLLEDGIVNTQYMGDGSMNRDYVHNHVFRASLTKDPTGDAFPLEASDVFTCSVGTLLDAAWVLEKMSAVAIVFNDSGVLQVKRVPVTKTVSQ